MFCWVWNSIPVCSICTRRRTVGDRAFAAASPTLWNSLPLDITDCASLTSFGRKLKTFCVFYIISTTTFFSLWSLSLFKHFFTYVCMCACMLDCIMHLLIRVLLYSFITVDNLMCFVGQIDGQEVTAATVYVPKPPPRPIRRSPLPPRRPPPSGRWRPSPPRPPRRRSAFLRCVFSLFNGVGLFFAQTLV